MAKESGRGFRNHVISRSLIRRFCAAHPELKDAPDALDKWFKDIRGRRFDCFADVKCEFGTASRVGRLVVFNVGGNKFRVVADIHFGKARIYLLEILTHEEYDRGRWKHRPT